MSEQRPGDIRVLQLVDADLARESAIRLVEDVLCGDFDALAEMLAGQEEVQRRRRDHDLCCLSEHN